MKNMKKYFLGCSGFSYSHWCGAFYPTELPSQKMLDFYSRHFNTVEINSTFYNFPKPQTVARWRESTPNSFIFSLKANKQITHMKKLCNCSVLLEKFFGTASELKGKTGCILFQLPPQMKKNISLLHNFAKSLPQDFKNVIEFRHASWFDAETFSLLRDLNIGYCIVSAPQLPCIIDATADFAYIRFHGITNWYSYNYSEQDLQYWAAEIKKLGKKCKQVFAYFNNDYNAFAVQNCLRLKELLE